jgi:hypothetical protein
VPRLKRDWAATLTVVYSLHDNPAFFGVGQGIMGSLFVIGMASIIGLKTKRLGIALTIGILLATLGTLHFANVQATLVVRNMASSSLARGSRSWRISW